jgi:hypothetical protein
VIEPRVYRAAFLPAILALVVAAFSLTDRPTALSADVSADILFDGGAAADEAGIVVNRFPDRSPGSAGDQSSAEYVSQELSALGFDAVSDRFAAGDRQLVNVTGTRTGATRERLVVMAPRDSFSSPDLTGSAADTATLLQLARALEGRATNKTIVLVSYDGSALGQAGVRRFLESAEDPTRIEQVLALSDVGAGPPAVPGIVDWSENLRMAGLGLTRTAEAALRQELPDAERPSGALDQLVHLVLPIGPGAQGVLLANGYNAVRISGSGQSQPPPGQQEIAKNRLGSLGRAVLTTLSALDEGAPLVQGPETYISIGTKLLPGWAVSVLAVALIIPALVASIDAAARARRRREPVVVWLLWIARPCLAFLAGLILALLLGLVGIAPDVGAASPPPGANPFDFGAAVVFLLVASVAAGTWLALRPLAELDELGRPDPTIPGAGVAASLVFSVVALLVWLPVVGLGNPYAALVVVVPLHLWMLATLGDAPMHLRTRALLYVLGLVPVALVGAYYLLRLHLDPAAGAWYLFQLVTGGQVQIRAALLICLFLGVAVAVLAIIITQGRGRRANPDEPLVRGPATDLFISSRG